MNVRLWAARRWLPGPVKRARLETLFALTADAFGCPIPPLPAGVSYTERLEAYASFTRTQAEAVLEHGEQAMREVRERLYRNTCGFGESLRAQLGVVGRVQAAAAMEILYKAIGIECSISSGAVANDGPGPGAERKDGPGPGAQGAMQFSVARCCFSSTYSAPVCRLMSALDEGVAAGLSGGGTLRFDRRITEGAPRCEGELLP